MIYKGQSALKIRCTCAPADLTGILSAQIKYKKPDGTTGAWAATVEDAVGGVIYYNVTTTAILDQAGVWTMWAYITFSDGRAAPGDAVQVTVSNEGYPLD